MSNDKLRSAGVPDPVAGTLSASGQSAAFSPQLGRPVILALSGTWAGTVQVEISYDDAATWHAMTAGGDAWASFTGNCCEAVDVPTTPGAIYRITFTRTSGDLTYRLGH